MLKLLWIWILSVVAGSADFDPVQARADAAERWEETRALLLRGVEEIAAPGVPGSTCAFGPNAVVVVADPNGVPVVSAGELGKSRLVVFGHGGYLTRGAHEKADTERLMRNILRWIARGKRRPVVFAPDGNVASAIEALGLRTMTDWEAIAKADVAVLDPSSLKPHHERLLRDFLHGGGGAVLGVTGWGWAQLSPGKTLAHDQPGNRLARVFGLAFGGETTKKTANDTLLTSTRTEPTLNVLIGLEALSSASLAPDDRTRTLARLRAALVCLHDYEESFVVPLRERMEAEPRDARLSDLAAAYDKREWRSLNPRFGAWSIVGVFPLPKRGKDLAARLKPEKELAEMVAGGDGPSAKSSYRTRGGKDRWRPLLLASDGEQLDVGPIILEGNLPRPGKPRDLIGVAAFLHREIVASEPCEVRVSVAHGAGGLRAWLNGVLVEDRPSGSLHGELSLPLVAGKNHLLFKLARTSGVWSFRFREAEGGVGREEVNLAIERGVDYLLQLQQIDGSWSEYSKWGPGFTAYALYALLKSKVTRDHPAIRRGMAYIYSRGTPYTYSRSCKILAMCAYEEEHPSLELRDEVEELIDGQSSSGLYEYPVYPGDNVARPPDLSITVYAALALHAAQREGIEIDRSVWIRLAEGVFDCREIGGRLDRGMPVGFTYRAAEGGPTGSMTTAGLTVLLLARDALGQVSKELGEEIEETLSAGLVWVDKHMGWRENPGNPGWQFYFVYGIERVGSLLDTKILGGEEWYDSGAEYLISLQKEDGAIPAESGASNGRDTVLALLFLNKATSPKTGGSAEAPQNLFTAEGPEDVVHLRAHGINPVDAWITGFSDKLEEECAWPRQDPGVRIEKVVYRLQREGSDELLDVGESVARRDGFGERFPIRVTLPGSGRFQLFGEVTLLLPPKDARLEPERRVVETGRVMLELLGVSEVDLSYAHDHDQNAVLDVLVEVKASSHYGDQTAKKAFDGYHGTRWHSDIKDDKPWILARFPRSVSAKRILFSHAYPRLKDVKSPRPSKIRVSLNGEDHYELEIDPDPMVKTVLEFEGDQRISELVVTILASVDRSPGVDAVGFSEIELIRGD